MEFNTRLDMDFNNRVPGRLELFDYLDGPKGRYQKDLSLKERFMTRYTNDLNRSKSIAAFSHNLSCWVIYIPSFSTTLLSDRAAALLFARGVSQAIDFEMLPSQYRRAASCATTWTGRRYQDQSLMTAAFPKRCGPHHVSGEGNPGPGKSDSLLSVGGHLRRDSVCIIVLQRMETKKDESNQV